MTWWITCSGIAEGLTPDPGWTLGPYPTAAAARKAIKAGAIPPNCPGGTNAGGGGQGGGQGGGGGGGHVPPAGTRLQAVIAQAAIAAIGHCYVWGGAPGPAGRNCWDCSSAVNFWVGVEAGAAIPGYPPGGYDGTVHGPSTLGWLDWLGQGVFLITRAEVVAGDIMCWQTHMGVAVSSTDMVSALQPGLGTQRTPIDGLMPGETLNPLRLHAVDPSVKGIGVIGFAGDAALNNDTRAIARFTKRTVPLTTLARSVGGHGWRP